MAARERLIANSGALVDGGPGLRFAIGRPGAEVAAFAIRFRGRVHAFVNSCAHQDVELDWLPGIFFDDEGEHLVCAMHGARYAPDTGCCVDGPCRGARLTRVAVRERTDDGAIVLGDATSSASTGSDPEGKPQPDQEHHG
jgi:nitrite reductase/ring-hydroxylating ferredoxin subunit